MTKKDFKKFRKHVTQTDAGQGLLQKQTYALEKQGKNLTYEDKQ